MTKWRHVWLSSKILNATSFVAAPRSSRSSTTAVFSHRAKIYQSQAFLRRRECRLHRGQLCLFFGRSRQAEHSHREDQTVADRRAEALARLATSAEDEAARGGSAKEPPPNPAPDDAFRQAATPYARLQSPDFCPSRLLNSVIVRTSVVNIINPYRSILRLIWTSQFFKWFIFYSFKKAKWECCGRGFFKMIQLIF